MSAPERNSRFARSCPAEAVVNVENEIFGPILTLDNPESRNTIVMPRQIREICIGPESIHLMRA